MKSAKSRMFINQITRYNVLAFNNHYSDMAGSDFDHLLACDVCT